MDKVIYRKATLDDAYGIEYVASHSWKETYYDFMPKSYLDNRIANIETRTERTREFLKNNDNYYVAIINDKIIGILYYSNSKEEKYLNYGYLGAIYVLKDYQGLGIGKELFKMAVKGIITMGFNDMYLECLKGNTAIDFYKHFGGNIVDTIDYPISDFSVKADIVEFNDLNKILQLIEKGES